MAGLVLSQVPRRERPKNRDKGAKRTTTKAPVQYDDDDGTSDQCPEPDGYFADADQCDKYYACTNGQIEGNFITFTAGTFNDIFNLLERLCDDGLVFNDYDINVEKCDLPLNIDCSKRSNLRELNYLAERKRFI